jgi:hypothetical protein
MRISGVSTGNDCMSLLNQWTNTKTDKSFAAILQQALTGGNDNQVVVDDALAKKLNLGKFAYCDATGFTLKNGITINEPRVPVDAGTYEPPANYDVFRQTVLTNEAEIPDECFSVGSDGTRYLNQQGVAFLTD